MKNYSILLWLCLFFASIALSQNFSEPLTGLYGGDITALAVAHDGTVFAGTSSGIFRSTDNGEHWTFANAGLRRIKILSLLEANGVLYAGNNDGIYTSRDNGISWKRSWYYLPDPGTSPVPALAVDSSGYVYAAHRGIIRSGDQGETWQQIFSYDHGVSRIFAGPNGDLYANGSFAYRLTNHGETWNRIESTLTEKFSAMVVNKHGVAFAVNSGKGFYRSTDNGTTWLPILDPNASGPISPLWPTAVTSIEADSSGCVYAQAGSIFRSTDNGVTWTARGWLPSSVLRAGPKGLLFAGTMGRGLFRSNDGGQTWDRCNQGISSLRIRDLAVGKMHDLFAATSMGVFRSTDHGATWNNITLTILESPYNGWDDFIRVRIGPDSTVYVATEYGQPCIYRSSNNGGTWTALGYEQESTRYNVFAADKNGMLVVDELSGFGCSLYRSTDKGLTTNKIGDLPSRTIVGMNVSADNHVQIGNNDGYVYHSADGGQTWTLSLHDWLYNYRNISFASDSIGTVYAASTDLCRSRDNGATWTKLNPLEHYDGFSSVVVGRPGQLFAGLWNEWGGAALVGKGGVIRSTDFGETWTKSYAGLNDVSVSALVIDEDGFLYAGTENMGIFRSTECVTGVGQERETVPREISLTQNYPNPFNPSTTIAFSLPERSHVSLKIFDVMGREVATLVSEELPAGTYQRQWNASGMSSGMYFYRLRAGAYSETKRLLLVK